MKTHRVPILNPLLSTRLEIENAISGAIYNRWIRAHKTDPCTQLIPLAYRVCVPITRQLALGFAFFFSKLNYIKIKTITAFDPKHKFKKNPTQPQQTKPINN